MKRLMITILTVMAACLAAQAQYIGERPQRLERRGGHLYTETGTRIDLDIASSIMNEESLQLYSSGRRLYRAGVIVSSIGGGFGAVGIVLFATSLGSLNTADSWVPYFLGTVTSIPCLIIGGTMLLRKPPNATLPEPLPQSPKCPSASSRAASDSASASDYFIAYILVL